MTEISFHFNVPDRCGYACRLLRKAVRKGAQVVVVGPAAALTQLDRALWDFDALEFLPHVLVPVNTPIPPRAHAAPVWLLEDPTLSERHDVLLNLGAEPMPGFESYARLIEIVSPEPADRASARLRWKHYVARGYAIEQHDLAVST